MIKKIILVVDDDLLMTRIVRYILSRNGFEVLEAANGREALGIMNEPEQNIDLIITDYGMSEINGLELAKSIKIHPKHQNTPLILITSHTTITSTLDKHCNVFNEIIYKPFLSELILNKVIALLAK